MLSPLSWNPDPDHQDEMIEDQHEKGKGSSTVMAARKHAMRENLFRSNHGQQGPPRNRRFIIHLSLSLCVCVWSIHHVPIDQLLLPTGAIAAKDRKHGTGERRGN